MGQLNMFLAENGYGDLNLNVIITVTVLVVIALICFRFTTLRDKNIRRSRLPPRPGLRLPLIGHLHLLGKAPHRSLTKISEKYGPVMFLWMGCRPTVVVSTYGAANHLLYDHEDIFSSRPPLQFVSIYFDNAASAFSDITTQRWRDIRKYYARDLLSPKRLASSRLLRDEAIQKLRQDLAIAANGDVELRHFVANWFFKIMALVLTGMDHADHFDGVPAQIAEMLEQVTSPLNLGDVVPPLRWLESVTGFRQSMVRNACAMKQFADSVVRQRLQVRRNFAGDSQNDASPVDGLLETVGIRDYDTWIAMPDNEEGSVKATVKSTIIELFAASMDSTVAAVEWTMAELLQRPALMEKLQKEIDAVVEAKDCLKEEEMDMVPYLGGVVKESLRLHPPAALLVPHSCSQATEVAGWFLPEGTTVMVNAWAIGRDRLTWGENAEEFVPERWLQQEMGNDGVQDNGLLAFGRGRRRCPGNQLGLAMVSLVVGNLVHGFNWSCAEGFSVDMESEVLGISANLAEPLRLTLAPRV